jgi:hypothetical protein
MARGIIVLLLVMTISLLIFEIADRNAKAQSTDQPAIELSQVLEGERLILQKLDVIDKKLDVIKMRIKF